MEKEHPDLTLTFTRKKKCKFKANLEKKETGIVLNCC